MDKDKEPKKVTMKSEERVSVRKNPDGSIVAGSVKSLALDMSTIRAVGVENLTDIEVHEINRIFNSVSHYIRFIGGGEIRFSYNSKGEILDFTCNNVEARIINGDQLIFRRAAGKS